MDYSTFLGQVQNRAELGSEEAAVRVTRVTLEALGERLGPGEAGDLAAQLPAEIGRHLEKADEAESFSWDEFVDRIADRGGYEGQDERGDAVFHARVVVDVVEDATTPGELSDVRDQLPEEFEALFDLADQEEEPVAEKQRPG